MFRTVSDVWLAKSWPTIIPFLSLGSYSCHSLAEATKHHQKLYIRYNLLLVCFKPCRFLAYEKDMRLFGMVY